MSCEDLNFLKRSYQLSLMRPMLSHYGDPDFKKKIGELGIICTFLPQNTSIVTMSATLTGWVQQDVLKTLHFPPTDYIKLNMGNEWPNVSLTMHMIENPLNSLTDLDFIMPWGIQNIDNIPKTFVYVDNIVNGIDIEDHLTEHLPESMWGLGIIRCYNAAFSLDYQKAVMHLFKQTGSHLYTNLYRCCRHGKNI